MPIVPDALERLFLRTDQVPPILQDYMGALAFRAVSTALELGVFEALAGGSKRPQELAAELKADERGIAALLAGLDGLGYVRRFRGRYRNARSTSRWLLRSSPSSMVGPARFFQTAVNELWQGLDESVRSGNPKDPLYAALGRWPNLNRDFQAWLAIIADICGAEVVGKVGLSQHAQRLLDVGGGHALYSILFCQRYPQLQATVVDLAPAVEVGRENVAQAGLEGRIQLEEGDFLKDRLGSGYDVALVFNVLHGQLADANRELLERLATALNPGGLIVVWDQFTDSPTGSMGAAVNGLMGLGYHHLLGGQMYRTDDVERWLTVAGFRGLRRSRVMRAPGSNLIMGTRA